jgi:L,D-peptidoglycan transpeptidase YkuD (ErfK/YbiS/YcfS/YnhG family)
MGDYQRADRIVVECTTHRLQCVGMQLRCALGKGGYGIDKYEGDGKTPLGIFPLRGVMVREDRFAVPPLTVADVRAISPTMGWCDDPGSPDYNQLVTLPFAASHEKLWREDGRYDVIIPLGYNDAPVIAGRGSAIFFHCASDDYQPTEGCVAISHGDMLRLLPLLTAHCLMEIRP